MTDCLPSMNQYDIDADKADAPIGYINRSIFTSTREVIKFLITSLIRLQVVLCLDLDAIF